MPLQACYNSDDYLRQTQSGASVLDERKRHVTRFVFCTGGVVSSVGKGVTVARTEDEAIEAIRSSMDERVFGASGNEVVVEEFMDGEEASFFAVTDGREDACQALPLLLEIACHLHGTTNDANTGQEQFIRFIFQQAFNRTRFQ